MMKRLLSVMLLLAFFGMAQAQDASKLVPQDVVAVFSVNSESYSKKVDMDKVWELDMFKMVDEQIKNQAKENYDLVSLIYKDPKAAGVNLNPKSFGYVQSMDSLFLIAHVFNMADKKKFEDFLNNGVFNMGPKVEVQNGKGFRYAILGGEGAVAWSSDAIMFATVQGEQKNLYSGLDYDDEDYYEKLDARREAFRKTKSDMLVKKLDMVIAKNVKANTNANFAAFKSSTYDVGMWVDASFISELAMQNAGNDISMQMYGEGMMESLKDMTKDSYYHGLLTFDAGEMNMNLISYTNERLFNLYKDVYNKKVTPKMFEYVNGSNLLGFGSFAIDIKKAVEASLEVYKPMLAGMPQVGPMSTSAFDLLGIALDEDALAGIFKGDMLVAVTDFKEVESTYIDYEYDEDYNLKKVEKTKKEKQPLFIAELGIGNKDNFMKIVNALKNSQLMSEKDGMYKIVVPDAKGLDLRMKIDGDIAIFTNDIEVLSKGVSKKDMLNPSITAEALKNSQFVYFNFTNAITKAMEMNPYASDSDKEMADMVKKYMNDAKFKGVKMGNKSMGTTFTVTMKDSKKNSAMQAFEMANEVYLLEQKKKEERMKAEPVEEVEEDIEIEDKPDDN